MMRAFWMLGALLLLGGAVGCKPKGEAPSSTEPNAGPVQAKIYTVKGVVQSVEADRKAVVVKHEAIPDFMPAMTMPLEVRDPKELEGLMPGMQIEFRMHYTEKELWIDQIRKLGAEAAAPNPNAPQPFRRVREVEPVEVGDPLPDYTLTNELEKVIQLSDFKGKALGFTFIFTRCPDPKFCPLMTSRFEEAARELNASGLDNWHLLSISFDPANDTPKTMRSYARRHKGYDPERWNFATGSLIDVTALGEQFGLNFYWEPSGFPISHNLRTVVVDAGGKVQKVFVGNEWTVTDFVQEMKKAAEAAPPR